ncbi:hypothetical protein EVAR_13380_1 [Eumeta japonica]|uniref:Uncharacterized protein n=1 Tax=Eumeta variegata TaxID=151549 RepID=A0A4C1TS49_EUMVA|nr:hypothetical protein EVAR_13380_1 [Eumeta japonica]
MSAFRGSIGAGAPGLCPECPYERNGTVYAATLPASQTVRSDALGCRDIVPGASHVDTTKSSEPQGTLGSAVRIVTNLSKLRSENGYVLNVYKETKALIQLLHRRAKFETYKSFVSDERSVIARAGLFLGLLQIENFPTATFPSYGEGGCICCRAR